MNKSFNKLLKTIFHSSISKEEEQDLRLILSSPLFDKDWYLDNYEDVRQERIDPYIHYLRKGGYENRNPGPLFDSSLYLAEYEDVRQSGINPLVHYLRFGINEKRRCAPVVSKKKPVLLLCNGPSCENAQLPEDLENFEIVRFNFFFLEKKKIAGSRVDHFFCAVNEPILHDNLKRIVDKNIYNFKNFYSPVSFNHMLYSDGRVLGFPFFHKHQLIDHWEIIATCPRLVRRFMIRPLPTSGLQALATLAIQGYREFHIAGMDFYSTSKTERYYYNIPKEVSSKLDQKHMEPGYECGAHKLEIDKIFLFLILKEYPEIKIITRSDMPLLNKYLKRNKF